MNVPSLMFIARRRFLKHRQTVTDVTAHPTHACHLIIETRLTWPGSLEVFVPAAGLGRVDWVCY